MVGGGLVGLCAALFLRRQGVEVTVVERRVTTSPQPKARRINIRTMELFRQLGIADRVLEAARDLGKRYPAGAFIDDGRPHTMERLDVSGQPGTRLPHTFLTPDRSTLDLIGTEFVLFTGPAGTAWRAAADQEGIDSYTVDETYRKTVGLNADGALLVRPDQIIAWRAPELTADPGAALRTALELTLYAPVPHPPPSRSA